MKPRAGLFIDESKVVLAIVSGRGTVDCVPFEMSDTLGSLAAGELDSRSYNRRRLRVGLDRSLAVVKVLELPRAEGGNLGEMVRFELDRHVPFPAEDVAYDWRLNPSGTDGPLHVLVGACESRRVAQVLRLVHETRRRPATLSIASHELWGLLPRKMEIKRTVWAHRHDGRTDLVFLSRAGVRLSRTVPAESARDLVHEIQQSLPLLQWPQCEAVWISGDDDDLFLAAPALAELGTAASEPPYSAGARLLVDSLPEEQHGAALLALAVAVSARRPRIDLLPVGLRPRRASPSQLVTVAMLAMTALLGLGALGTQVWQRERYLARLSQEIRQLDPEVKAVERLAAEVAQKNRLVTALQSVQARGLRPLPFMRDLTGLVPQDSWIQGVTMDPQGVEIIGQAGTASTLIPALEASPWLERVEFTSPVTKGQGKEQFRLRASWEKR